MKKVRQIRALVKKNFPESLLIFKGSAPVSENSCLNSFGGYNTCKIRIFQDPLCRISGEIFGCVSTDRRLYFSDYDIHYQNHIRLKAQATSQYSADIRVAYSDVGPDLYLRLGALFRHLYQVTLDHRKEQGQDIQSTRKLGMGWFVRKMHFTVVKYPEYENILHIDTRVSGIHGIRLYREYNISIDKIRIGHLTSEWVYMDLDRRRPQPVPTSLIDGSTPGDKNPVADWKPPSEVPNPETCTISVRSGDFDSNGHVNNTTYIDYLETACHQCLAESRRIRQCNFAFLREIPPGTETVEVALSREGSTVKFRMCAGATRFSAGELAIF